MKRKPLEQIAYEAFIREMNDERLQPWEVIADPSPRRGSPIALRAWKAVARAVALELVTEQRAKLAAILKSDPSRPVKCATCGARTSGDEKHTCFIPCTGCGKRFAAGEKHECKSIGAHA